MNSVTSAMLGEACKARSILRGTRIKGGGEEGEDGPMFGSVIGGRIRVGQNNSKVQYIKATRTATCVMLPLTAL